MLAVFWNGEVTVFCHDSYGDLIVGDLNELSLEEIWHGEKIEELRERFLKKDYVELICEDCDLSYRIS